MTGTGPTPRVCGRKTSANVASGLAARASASACVASVTALRCSSSATDIASARSVAAVTSSLAALNSRRRLTCCSRRMLMPSNNTAAAAGAHKNEGLRPRAAVFGGVFTIDDCGTADRRWAGRSILARRVLANACLSLTSWRCQVERLEALEGFACQRPTRVGVHQIVFDEP
jgi:hypothetical protein